MTSITQNVVAQFVANFEGTDKEFSLIEMKKILEDIYKANSKSNKNKVKREPSAYNAFMKEKMQEFKNSSSELNAKDRMKKIAELWKAKGTTSEEPKEEVKEEPKEEIQVEESKKETATEEPKKKKVAAKK